MPIEINGVKSEPYTGLTKVKKQVTFKVFSAPLKAKTEDGVIEKPLTSLILQSTYTRRNQSGGHDTVRYYDNKTPRPTKEGLDYTYTPDCVIIENGQMIVNTKANPDLYWWLANHPDNEANVVYDGEKNQDAKHLIEARRTPFQFTEADRSKAKTAAAGFSKEVEVAKCISIIGDEDELNNRNAVALYRAYGHTDTDELLDLEEYTQIRKSLMDHAKVDPAEFMKKMESAALFLEAQVNEAIQKHILVYDQTDEFSGWSWGKTEKDFKKKKNLCPIGAHQYEQRVELLIEFLRTNEAGTKAIADLKREIIAIKVGSPQ